MARYKRQTIKKSQQKAMAACYQTMLHALKLVLIGLGFLIVCYGGWQAGDYLYCLPYFEVRQIYVRGNHRLSDKQIRHLSGIQNEQNIFTVKLQDVIQNLSGHPYLKQVMVERKLPQTIRIRVRERKGIALLKTPGAYYLLDEDGMILENVGLRNKGRWPVLAGISQQTVQVGEKISRGSDLLVFLKARGLLGAFARFDVSKADNPVLVTRREGIKVYLGQGGWEEKMEHFALVYQGLRARVASVKSIDLRYRQMVVLEKI